MIVTSVVAKISDQTVPDYVLHLSADDLEVIIDGLYNTQDWKLDNKDRNYQIASDLRKLATLKNFNDR